jgi:hypothetical protein
MAWTGIALLLLGTKCQQEERFAVPISYTCSRSLPSLCQMLATRSKCWAKVDALIYKIHCPNPYRRFADTSLLIT